MMWATRRKGAVCAFFWCACVCWCVCACCQRECADEGVGD